MKLGVLLGLLWGIPIGMAAVIYLDHLDALAQQSTRSPGADVVNLHGRGRDIEIALNRHRRTTGRQGLA